MTTKILASMVALLVATSSQAVLLDLSFSGTISSILDPNFATLLKPGDAVSGLVEIDITPPSIFNIDLNSGRGSYTVPAGQVSFDGLNGYGGGTQIAAFGLDGHGSGPRATAGGFENMLIGVDFYMAIDGIHAPLSDYLALSANDFTIFLDGSSISSSSGLIGEEVAKLNVTSAAFSLSPAAIPDNGPTNLLLNLGIGFLLVLTAALAWPKGSFESRTFHSHSIK